MITRLFFPSVLCLALLTACASDNADTTVVRTETTTTTVRTNDPAPVTPRSNADTCYALLHDLPLIQAAPQRHFAVVPGPRDVLPDDVFLATLPAGTRLRLVHTKAYEGQGGAEARFTFALVETGLHAGKTVSTDRIGLNYAGTVTTQHVRAVPCP